MVILRLDSRNRMVTKGYRKGVYEWVKADWGIERPEPHPKILQFPITQLVSRTRGSGQNKHQKYK